MVEVTKRYLIINGNRIEISLVSGGTLLNVEILNRYIHTNLKIAEIH